MAGFDIVGYMIFAFVTSITPGPNNYLLFSYGKQHGFKDSGKLMFGIFLGFSALLYITGYGIGELIAQDAVIALVLKIISSLWLLYLGFVLSNLSSKINEVSVPKVGFFQGFFMQFVNPKAWIMAISGASAFLPHLSNIHLSVFVFTLSFGFVGVPCMIAWITLGDVISRFITSARAHRVIGIVLFLLMLVCVGMIWM